MPTVHSIKTPLTSIQAGGNRHMKSLKLNNNTSNRTIGPDPSGAMRLTGNCPLCRFKFALTPGPILAPTVCAIRSSFLSSPSILASSASMSSVAASPPPPRPRASSEQAIAAAAEPVWPPPPASEARGDGSVGSGASPSAPLKFGLEPLAARTGPRPSLLGAEPWPPAPARPASCQNGTTK